MTLARLLSLLMVVCFMPVLSAEAVTTKKPFASLVVKHQSRAGQYIEEGDLRLALQSLEVVRALAPGTKDIDKRISTLEKEIDIKAKRHFKRGVEKYKAGSMRSARRAFLRTLALIPEHPEAIAYLKQKMSMQAFASYEVVTPQSPASIALALYGDAGLASLVSYFNDTSGPDALLKAGTIVRLPELDIALVSSRGPLTDKAPRPAAPKLPLTKKPALPKKAAPQKKPSLQKKPAPQKKAAPPKTKTAGPVTAGPGKPENLMTAALNSYNFAKYPKAMEYTNQALKVDAGNVRAKKLKNLLRQKAEDRYNLGYEHFANERFAKAVRTWRYVLKINPEHEHAAEDIQKTRIIIEAIDLFNKEKYTEARKRASKCLDYDLTRRDAKDLFEKIILNAEKHYKRGLKQFLNDNIAAAIVQWDKTLEIEPTHDKALKGKAEAKAILKHLGTKQK